MKRKLTKIIQKHGQWYIAYLKELPGVNTQGRTLAKARRNLELAQILSENRGPSRRRR